MNFCVANCSRFYILLVIIVMKHHIYYILLSNKINTVNNKCGLQLLLHLLFFVLMQKNVTGDHRNVIMSSALTQMAVQMWHSSSITILATVRQNPNNTGTIISFASASRW